MVRQILIACFLLNLGLNISCQQLNQGWRATQQPPVAPTVSMKVLGTEFLSVPAKSSRLTLSGQKTWSPEEMSLDTSSQCFFKFPQSAQDRRIQLRAVELSQESVQPLSVIWKEYLSDMLSLTQLAPFTSRTSEEMLAVVEGSSSFQEALGSLETQFAVVLKNPPEVRQVFSVSEPDGKKWSLKLICDGKVAMSLPELEQLLLKSKSILAPVHSF